MHNFKFLALLITLLFSHAVFSQIYQGQLEVLVFDDFKNSKSKTLYQLHDSNEIYVLDLPKELDKTKLLTGVSITIEGELKKSIKAEEKIIKVKSLTIKNTSYLESPTIDEHKAVALIVNFRNLKASDTITSDDLDQILYTSPRSTQKNFVLSSFNQVNFIRPLNNYGKPSIYTVTLNYDALECNYEQWAKDATNAAKVQGIDLTPFQHIILVVPQTVNCSWGGLGNLGCGEVCYSWVKAYKPQDIYSQLVYAHELGHNIGMQHASTDLNNDGQIDSEYGDAACTMGTGDFQYLKEVNAPHRDQMHWFDSFSDHIKIIQADGDYTIYPLEAGMNASGLLALKIKKNDYETYYVSYRKNIGPFGPGTPTYLNNISIHRTNSVDTRTYFIKSLNLNESFVDVENQINVKVTFLEEDRASVYISLNPNQKTLSAFKFYNNDNTKLVGYPDWDPNYWKGNCPSYTETVGLSASTSDHRPNAIACLIQSTSKASGLFTRSLGGVSEDSRYFSRNNDWDPGYYKWECGLNEYVSGFSQDPGTNQLHKIRCAKGDFSNGGQNLCETRFVSNKADDRGSKEGGDWDPSYYKAQCSNGKLIFGVSVDVATRMPHKILCCNK